MKRPISPVSTILFLVLGCVIFRLLGSLYPSLIPNISPLMAMAFVGAAYLPHRWGWLVGPVVFLATDLAFLSVNYQTDGSMFSWWTAVSFGVYALAGGLGIFLSQNKTLVKMLAGTVACSLIFYVIANTFSWWHNITPNLPGLTPYAPTLAGWWQANTVGMPGFVPSWTFLRNGVIGDIVFGLLFILALDRALIFGRSATRSSTQSA